MMPVNDKRKRRPDEGVPRWILIMAVAALVVVAVSTFAEANNRPLRYYAGDGGTAMTFYANSSGDQNRSLWGINTDDPVCELDINGSVCINRTGFYFNGVNISGGGAPSSAEYVTMSLDASLSGERVLTPGKGITVTDTGANGVARINVTGLEDCSGSQSSQWNGSEWNCVSAGSSDNNYTTGVAFENSSNNYILQVARSGISSNLTAFFTLNAANGIFVNSTVISPNASTCGSGQYSRYDGSGWSCHNDASGSFTYSTYFDQGLNTSSNVSFGNVIPATNNTYDLGSSTRYWRDLYVSNGTIHLGSGLNMTGTGTDVLVNSVALMYVTDQRYNYSSLIGLLYTNVTALQTSAAGAYNNYTAMYLNVTGLQTSNTSTNTRIDSVNTTATGAVTVNNAQYLNITGLQTSNTSTNALIAAQYTNITTLQTTSAAMYTNVTALQSSSSAYYANITGLQTSNTSTNARIDAQYLNITGLQTSNTSTNARIDSINTTVLAQYLNITALQASNTSIYTIIAGQYTNITNLQTLAAATYTNVTAIQAVDAGQYTNITALQAAGGGNGTSPFNSTNNATGNMRLGAFKLYTSVYPSTANIGASVSNDQRLALDGGGEDLVFTNYASLLWDNADNWFQMYNSGYSGINVTNSGGGKAYVDVDGKIYTDEVCVDGLCERSLTNGTQQFMVKIESDFLDCSTQSVPGILGVAVSSGTLTANTGTIYNPGLCGMRDSTTAQGGYRFTTSATAILINGSEKATFIFKNGGVRTNNRAQLGFTDSTAANTTPTDGVWFWINGTGTGANLYANGRANGAATSSAALALDTATLYVATISIDSAATSANMTVYNATTGTILFSTAVTTIPTASGRETGFGVLVSEGTTDAAANVLIMDYMSFGIDRYLNRLPWE